jgi:hypothetical protein
MIKREDIKEGLRFTLPNYRFESREDEMKYNHRLVNGGSDYIPDTPCYTDIYHGESKTTLRTSYRPTFEVIGAKTMSKVGYIYTANCKCLESGKSMFINISYIESCGKVVEPEKNDKTTAVTLEDSSLIMTKIAAKKIFDDQNKFFTEVKKDRDLAKCLKLVREVRDSCIVQSQLKVTLDYLKDYIGVLKNEPDARSFKKITDEMYDTFKAKNHDYGSSFSNLFKECGMIYAYGHMAEKLERVKSLMKDEAKVKGEGMKDSLKDLANYAILTIMELERKEEENGK